MTVGGSSAKGHPLSCSPWRGFHVRLDHNLPKLLQKLVQDWLKAI